MKTPNPAIDYLAPTAFAKFVKQFDPVDVFYEANKMQRSRNLSLTEYTDLVIQKMDSSPKLLALKVQNGNPRVVPVSSRRQESIKDRYKETWKPPPGLSIFNIDRFSYRDRLYELMKQAIYQARNKMIIMQLIRRKRFHKKMFKMGYLVGKTDTAVKIFHKVSFHAWRHCWYISKEHDTWFTSGRYFNFNIYDMMMTHMRMLHLWFQAELLTDLVIRNDVAYHEAYAVKGHWNFTD